MWVNCGLINTKECRHQVPNPLDLYMELLSAAVRNDCEVADLQRFASCSCSVCCLEIVSCHEQDSSILDIAAKVSSDIRASWNHAILCCVPLFSQHSSG